MATDICKVYCYGDFLVGELPGAAPDITVDEAMKALGYQYEFVTWKPDPDDDWEETYPCYAQGSGWFREELDPFELSIRWGSPEE